MAAIYLVAFVAAATQFQALIGGAQNSASAAISGWAVLLEITKYLSGPLLH